MVQAETPYLIWSVEHGRWWGPGRAGYTVRLSEAGRYSDAEALLICIKAMPGTSTRLGALPELPVRLEDVETMTGAYQIRFNRLDEPWM